VRGAALRQLAELARAAGAAEWVELVEWVPADRVAGYIAASRVCLVPHNDFEHTQTTVPHKLFEYMLMGKPVLVGSCAPLQRIVREAQAGLVFQAGSAAGLAECLIGLHRSSEEDLALCGENGRRAALGPFAWRHDARRLVDMYRGLELALDARAPLPARPGARPQLRVAAR